jgi:hypothetical protein
MAICSLSTELLSVRTDGKLEQGLSARRIFQDLRGEHGFGGSYYSVRWASCLTLEVAGSRSKFR